MKRIEFIGGPGVGKSTLLNEILKLRNKKDYWLTPQEARIYLAKTIDVYKKMLKLMQVFLTINPTNRYKGFATSIILSTYEKNIFDSTYEKYIDVADAFLDSSLKDDKTNAVKKLASASYYYKLLLNEIMLFDYFNLQKVIVFDESVIHNNAGFRDRNKTNDIFNNHANTNSSIVPAGIIYCYMDEKKYMVRRKERITQGKGMFLEGTLNDIELETLFKRSLESSKEKVIHLKNYGISVIEVDMEKPVKENAKIVYEFINSFQ